MDKVKKSGTVKNTPDRMENRNEPDTNRKARAELSANSVLNVDTQLFRRQRPHVYT